MSVCTSVRQTNSLTRLHYDINHRRRWVACHLSSWLTYTHIHRTSYRRRRPFMRFACNAYVEACTAQLPALAFVRTVQFFRPINNERKFIFPSAVFAPPRQASESAGIRVSLLFDRSSTSSRFFLQRCFLAMKIIRHDIGTSVSLLHKAGIRSWSRILHSSQVKLIAL